MRISLGDVSLWFDVSGPSVIPQGDTTAERPVVVAVHGGTPGWAGESRQFLARMIKNMDVSLHYASQQASGFDPWSVTAAVRCPVLVLTGEDDPICPLPVVEELVSRLPAETTRLVRLPGARHTIFRDRPDLAFPAVRDFVFQINASQPAS